MKKSEKQRNEQHWTVAYSLVLQTLTSLLSSFFFYSDQLVFPSKIMSCKLNHNLICLGLEPLSKDLRINLKLFTNRNARFHWTMLLGPLSKVALRVISLKVHIISNCDPFGGNLNHDFVKKI
jgi:hypothetical protein